MWQKMQTMKREWSAGAALLAERPSPGLGERIGLQVARRIGRREDACMPARAWTPADRLMLLACDMAAYALATLAGFAWHGELVSPPTTRVLATFIPFFAAWLVTAPWLKTYDLEVVSQPRQVWRAPLAALYAAPLGAILRAAWLGTPALPVFAAVMACVTALAVLAGRCVSLILLRR
jgi:hypothetical protein